MKVKRILRNVGIGLGVLILGFIGAVAAQPNDFRVERRATIAAPAKTVFAHVNDYRKWQAWSPWAKLDPNAKATFEGPASGKGAKFGWKGNDKVGEGRMEITESRPTDLIRMNLEFIKPMAAKNTTEFTFKPEGNGTAVVWTMTGTNNFAGKAFCLVMNMDKMVGGDFEKGLASMKAIAEAEHKAGGKE